MTKIRGRIMVNAIILSKLIALGLADDVTNTFVIMESLPNVYIEISPREKRRGEEGACIPLVLPGGHSEGPSEGITSLTATMRPILLSLFHY